MRVLAGTIQFLSGTAVAQDAAPPPADPLEEIIVTGTPVKDRSALDSTVPVDVFDEQALRSAGAVGNEVGQALAVVAPSFFFPRQSNSGTSDHVRAGQLRGLSPDQMVVLVNGRRRHTSAVVNSETKIGRGTAAVDLNAIPLGSIQRIEVLRHGAGAQYGSDAIAGVVNILLDRDADTSVGVITAGAHVTHEGAIDRTLVDGKTLTLEAESGFHVGDDGFLRFGLEALAREATNRAGFDQIPFFYLDPYVSDPEANLALQGERNYREGDPRTGAGALWLHTEVPAGDATLYAFGTASLRDTRGASFFRYPVDDRNVIEVYPDGYLPLTAGQSFDLSVNAGARAEVGGWGVDLGGTWGRNVFMFGAVDSLNASLGTASPTEFDSGTYRFDQISVDATALRDLPVAGFAAPLTFVFGVGTRQELFGTTAGEPASYEAGPEDLAIGAQGAPGLTPADERSQARGVYDVHVALAARIAKPWFVDLAGRYELYSDFGDTLTGKASTLVRPITGVGLRASVSNSFRAPSLAQLGFSDRSINFGENRSLVLTRTVPVDDPIAEALGASPLKPETAFDLSAGVVLGRFGGFLLTVDAFRIAVADRITLSERFFGQGIVDAIDGLPDAEGVESVRYFTNAVDTETLGIEAVARFAHQAGPGVLGIDLGASWFKTTISRFAPTPPELLAIDDAFRLVGVEEINTIENAAPTNKQVLTTTYDLDALAMLVRISRYGSATRVFNFGDGFEPEQTYGDEIQLDAEVAVHVTDAVELALGGSNLLDEYPDLSSDEINVFGNLPYDVLSPIGVNGRYLYLRSRVVF